MKVRSHSLRRSVVRGIIAVCAALLVTSAASTARAAGVVGTGSAPSCTDAALNTTLAGGGLVTFNCGGAATITITSTKTIGADTAIDGGSLITISGGHSVGVFHVNAGVNFTVQSLTIANGNGASNADGGGGGIYSYGTLTVTNSTVSDNSAGSTGGGIENNRGTLTVANTTFSGNSAGIAGRIAGQGGGIYSYGTLTVTNSTFTGNSASIAGNSPGYGGGGIYSYGTLTVTNSTFSGNGAGSTGQGGGIYTIGTLTVTNSTLSGNSAGYGGGGIYNNGSTLTVTNSTFSDNSAGDSSGGGIYSDFGSGGTLTVTNSTFSGNSAGYYGGGIVNYDGTLTVTNSTFTGNSASGYSGYGGGGIANVYAYVYATLTVTNSTFTKNSLGGGIGNFSANPFPGTVTVTNTIVDCIGNVTDGGHNIDKGTTCGFTGTGCTATTGTSFCNTDPVLDPTGLKSNGGPTQTIALQAGSPAINAGNESVCSTTVGAAPVDNLDQRGYVRPGTGATSCSIGAYEYNGVPAPPTTCTGDCDGSGDVTVNELITMVNIALGNAQPSACPHGIPSGAEVDIALIIQAVNAGLNGCLEPP